MLTRPTEGTFNRLTVKVNAGTNPDDSMDLFPVPLTFDSFSLDSLEDQDIDAIVQVIVNRINAVHPDYIVTVSKSWTGTNTEPLETVYTPPAAPDSGA
ncbi:hypothetical protein ACIQVL_48420 [Streptomyces sp. NPDC090499]|uniref:hypothetical protein n=1 Tax=Streptomyces sp. NPDC090499 TaxID=3365965 RepID=UPI003807309B